MQAASYFYIKKKRSLSDNEPHGTVNTGVVAEACGLDGRLAAGLEGVGLEVLHQRVEEDVACAGHAAADEEHLGVGGAGNGGQSHTEGVGHLVHLAGSEGVAVAGGIKDVLGLKILAAQDARLKQLVLTEKGRQFHENTMLALHQTDEYVASLLTEEENTELLRLLNKLRDALQ